MTDEPEYPVRFVRASRLVDGRRWETFDELARRER